VAWRAVRQKRRVAFFEIGDLSQRQIIFRFLARAARHPYRSSDGRWPVTIRVPTYLSPPSFDEVPTATVDFKERVFEAPLSMQQGVEAMRRVTAKLQTKRKLFQLKVFPSQTLTVAGLKSELDMMALDGWTPDVVVIDYADLFAYPLGAHDERTAIDRTWAQLRALSQERHCLVVTATQADAGSYDQKTQSRGNFSGDKRKNAHTTGTIGINVTAEEKELGVCRLNWIVRREGEYSWRKCCHVAGCLAIANPAIKSVF
jgi:hypothetical protein